MRDAFGNLLTSPDRLSRTERIDTVRGLAGRLQADHRVDVRWLGQCLSQWLEQGGALDVVLGLRPERGSRATAQRRVRQDEIDALLLRLSVECGGDAHARAVLKGARCRSDVQPIVDRLARLNAPKSKAAFTRARERSSRPNR